VKGDRSQPDLRSPYRGIEPFRYVDRENFFGQTRAIQELYAKILLYRLVVLFGDSGAGKSSLLNAALIPGVQKEGLRAERLRVRPDPEAPISVERIPITEREDRNFLPSIFADDDPDHAGDPVVTHSLESFLPTVRSKAVEARPLLIFDQFEELFTLFQQKESVAGKGKELQGRILDSIFQIVSDQELRAKVVIVIREDFLGKLEILAKSYPQVLDHRVRLRYLAQDDAQEAILGPFKGENQFRSRLTEDLGRRIIDDLSGHALDVLVPPTQVQIICSRLWDTYSAEKTEIGVAEYSRLEGVTGIVKRFFKSELQEIEPALQPLAVTTLGHLVTDAGTRDVVSEEKLIGLVERRGMKAEDVHLVLEVLEHRRLVNKTSQRGTYFYEVSSEYLIPPIRKESQQLAVEQAAAEAERKAAAEAAEQAREAFRTRELEQANALAAEQKQRAEEASRAARRLRRLVAVLAVVLVLALVAVVAAWTQRRNAILAKLQAVMAQHGAEESKAEAVKARDDALAAEKQAARAQAVYLQDQRKLSPASSTPSPLDLTPRVYTQVWNAGQIQQIKPVLERLRQSGFDVPGTEQVTVGPPTTELRFFRFSDRTDAERIKAILADSGLPTKLNYVQGFESSKVIRPHHFELWLGRPEQPNVEPQVVVLFLDASGRAEAEEIARTLNNYSPSVIPYNPKSVTWKFESPIELHYFHRDEGQEATNIANALQAKGIAVRLKYTPVQQDIPPKYFEIWLQSGDAR